MLAKCSASSLVSYLNKHFCQCLWQKSKLSCHCCTTLCVCFMESSKEDKRIFNVVYCIGLLSITVSVLYSFSQDYLSQFVLAAHPPFPLNVFFFFWCVTLRFLLSWQRRTQALSLVYLRTFCCCKHIAHLHTAGWERALHHPPPTPCHKHRREALLLRNLNHISKLRASSCLLNAIAVAFQL